VTSLRRDATVSQVSDDGYGGGRRGERIYDTAAALTIV
jgi:hypothetical protein